LEIWQNLLENAVKFMGDRPSPQIGIGVEHHGDGPVFFVRDNGIGIEPKYQTKLFNIFEKLNPKWKGRYGPGHHQKNRGVVSGYDLGGIKRIGARFHFLLYPARRFKKITGKECKHEW